MCDIIRRSLFFSLISLTVLLCNLLLGEASPATYKQQNLLPDGFVAGPSLTEEEFNTPIDTLRGIPQRSEVPPCTIMVPSGIAKNGITSSTQIWPNKRIPYVISAAYNTNERNTIAVAMNEYVKSTCITFVPRTNEVDYVVITAGGTGCSSYVGRIGGAQTVSLDPGCVYTATVIHELMHAAGFWHEQSRTDRDDYVDINWDNILPGYAYAFDKYSSAYIQLLGSLYDYGSVMHYSAYSFAVNPNIPTITAKNGSQLGNTVGFSSTDLLKLNRLYGCNAADTCWDDEVRNCPILVATGMCITKPQEMIVRCRKSCGFCNQPICQDDNRSCGFWADSGECQNSAAFMQLNCKRACRVCTYNAPSTVLPPSTTSTTTSTTTRTTTTTGSSGFVCRADGNYPSGPCSTVFYACSNGIRYNFDCPSNLVFSANLNRCDYRSNVQGCNE